MSDHPTNPVAVASVPPISGGPAERRSSSGLSMRQRRQIAFITLGAIGVFAFFRWLPTGTNLSHMDFRVDAKNPIDFCDPLNPQFIPVVAVASPVSMTLSAAPARAGQEVAASIRLVTASGKPIGPADLLVVHTERLHLLIIDPTLTDYQHVHPTPGGGPGQWNFHFTPRLGGTYRIFADFTPAATARGLYANTDLAVAAPPAEPGARRKEHGTRSREQGVAGARPEGIADAGAAAEPGPGSKAQGAARSESEATAGSRPGAIDGTEAGGGATRAVVDHGPGIVVDRDGYRFRLVPGALPMKPRTPIDLKFTIERLGGGRVPMEPVMGAFAHLVAFDTARSGFAHLHPMQLDLSHPPDAMHPELDFKIMIPTGGRYVIWSQVNLAGRQTFVPFWFDVE